MKAGRALLGWDQRALAQAAGLSLPTVQRMENSDSATVRGNVDSLVKVVQAFERAGLALIGDGESSHDGGRGVRLKSR